MKFSQQFDKRDKSLLPSAQTILDNEACTNSKSRMSTNFSQQLDKRDKSFLPSVQTILDNEACTNSKSTSSATLQIPNRIPQIRASISQCIEVLLHRNLHNIALVAKLEGRILK